MRRISMSAILALAGMFVLLMAFAPTQMPSRASRRLTVIGTPGAIHRFARLQDAGLRATPIARTADASFRKTYILPQDFTDAQLLATTDEALAAGLGYDYRLVRWTAPGQQPVPILPRLPVAPRPRSQ